MRSRLDNRNNFIAHMPLPNTLQGVTNRCGMMGKVVIDGRLPIVIDFLHTSFDALELR